MKYKVNGQIVIANSIGDAVKLSDSDKLHQMAYKLVQMGNMFDRANSAQSRYIFKRKGTEDETKINAFYNYALQVYNQLQKEVNTLKSIKEESFDQYAWPNSNETVDLLYDGVHLLYWASETFTRLSDRCRELSKKMKQLTETYQQYVGKRRLQRWDSITDSAAGDIAREIKSKYPQVKIKQTAKEYNSPYRGKYHRTILHFSNYPGEGATGFGNDPRTKDRDNWRKFLKYLFTKYTGEKDEIYVEPDRIDIYENFTNDSVNDTLVKDYKSCPNYPSTSSYSPNVILDQFNAIDKLTEQLKAHPEQADKFKKTKDDMIKRLKDYIDHYSKECSDFEKFSKEYSDYMRYVRQLFYDYQRSGRFADSIKDRDLTKAEESEIARELTRQFNIKFTTTGESCVEPTRGISSHSDLDKKIVSYLKSKGYKVEWDSIGDDGCYYLMK